MNRRTAVGLTLAACVVAGATAAILVAKRVRTGNLLASLPTISLEQFNSSARGLVSKAVEDVKLQPTRADRWGELGYVLAGNRAFAAAAQCFARAEELDPSNFRWPHLYAFCVKTTDRPAAVAALKRALEVQPNIVPTLGMLAEAYLEDGADKEADALLRPLVTDKTTEPRLLFAMARIEANAGAIDRGGRRSTSAGRIPSLRRC
jgi:cytochrome c-type biogenesis protein CcmH/NrfG